MILSCCCGKFLKPGEDNGWPVGYVWVSIGYLQASRWAVSLQHYVTERLLGEILAPRHPMRPAPPSEPGFHPLLFRVAAQDGEVAAVTFQSG